MEDRRLLLFLIAAGAIGFVVGIEKCASDIRKRTVNRA